MNKSITIGLLAVFSLACIVGQSNADVVVSKTNNLAGAFDGDGSGPLGGPQGTRAVTFTTADFTSAGAIDTVIKDITIEVAFAKLSTGGSAPFYQEIRFQIDGTNLINFGSFTAGNQGASFNGTVAFNQSAATVVNANTAVIPTIYPTPVRPVASIASYIGQLGDGGGSRNFTLSIADQALQDPLQFNSFTVRITAVPEPSALALISLVGVAGVFSRRRRVVRAAV